MQGLLSNHARLRRIPPGIFMGVYITVIILLFGKKTGAQINPAVTWTFFRLGKITLTNALFFTMAQFAGSTFAALVLYLLLGGYYAHPLINFGNWQPKPRHSITGAFIAEFVISFCLMFVVLRLSSSRRLEKYTAYICGALIFIYVIIELPLSGMSLNPARSFAAALVAHQWHYIWIYFLAPPLAMLTAAELYLGWRNHKINFLNNHNRNDNHVVTDDFKELQNYPV